MPNDSVSMDTAAAFAEICAKHGVDGTQTLVQHGHIAPDASSGTSSPTTEVPATSTSAHLAINSSQIERTAAYLLSMGIPEAQVNAAIAAEGYVEAPPTGEPETPSAFASAGAHEFDLSGSYLNRAGGLDVLRDVDRDMRQMLAATEFPAALAKSFVGDLLDANETGYNSQTSDGAKATYAAEQMRLACSATGLSRDALIAAARTVFNRMPADIKQGLAEQGVFESAQVLVAMANHGARLAARGKK